MKPSRHQYRQFIFRKSTKKILRHGCTVLTFVPKVSKIEKGSGNEYLSIFNQEKTPLEKIFEGEKLYLAHNPMSQAVRTAATLRMTVEEFLLSSPKAPVHGWLSRFFGITNVDISTSGRVLKLKADVPNKYGELVPVEFEFSLKGKGVILVGASVGISVVGLLFRFLDPHILLALPIFIYVATIYRGHGQDHRPVPAEDLRNLKQLYSDLMPAVFTTSGQRCSSLLMKASNCCEVPPTMSADCWPVMAVRTVGVCRT